MKQTSKEWLEDIGTTIAQPKPKKVVGWYCLSSKIMVNTIAFATHSKPNFIKRFLRSRSSVSIEPLFVSPDYTYVYVNTNIKYNINLTGLISMLSAANTVGPTEVLPCSFQVTIVPVIVLLIVSAAVTAIGILTFICFNKIS